MGERGRGDVLAGLRAKRSPQALLVRLETGITALTSNLQCVAKSVFHTDWHSGFVSSLQPHTHTQHAKASLGGSLQHCNIKSPESKMITFRSIRMLEYCAALKIR